MANRKNTPPDHARRILEAFGIDPDQYELAANRTARNEAAFEKACVRQLETSHTDGTGRQWHRTFLQ